MARIANAKNIIVGAGALYFGPSGVENNGIIPDDTTKPLTDPTNVTSSTASRKWEYAGYTTEGVTLNFEPDYGEINVDQLLDVARLFKQSQRVSLQTSMAEATLENLFVTIGAQRGDHILGDTAGQDTVGNAGGGNIYEDTGTGLLSTNTSAANTDFLDEPAAQTVTNAQVNAILELNGGALGVTPLERSIAVVGVGPEQLATQPTHKVERIYIGYRAISIEAVSNAIRRDEGTFFAANFRLMPSSTNASSDGNAAYGRIVDRVYDPGGTDLTV